MFGANFAQQYILKKGLEKFKEQGQQACSEELNQLHRRNCFTAVQIAELTQQEREKAMEALMFLMEKRDGRIKGHMVYNGKPTRNWILQEDSSSPTAAFESVMLMAVIEAHKHRDVMCADLPNAFIQAEIPKAQKGEEQIIMKITGVLVDMLVQLAPEVYGQAIVFEKHRKVLYVQVLRAIYGMLQSALLWYKRLRRDLEEEGFKFNPYDPCVANRMINGSQQTICFHVDDLKSSHKMSQVNDEFEKYLNNKYGGHGKIKAHQGKVHDYLGMMLDYTEKGKVKINMTKYIKEMIEDAPMVIKENDKATTPATDKLFEESKGKSLNLKLCEGYHRTVAKGLFASKRARPDIQPTIAVMCTRVQEPKENDIIKLKRLLKYLNATKEKCLTLSVENLNVIKWYVDASFAVHPNFKSHTRAVITMGEGSIINVSRKQKLNTKSSTDAELVAADDASMMILWTKLFLEEQGYHINKNILYQDNKSAILLEENGRKSAGKRSRALNV